MKILKKFPNLIEDIKQANEAAKKAASEVDDGGSCNLDHVIWRYPGRYSKAWDKLLDKTGVSWYKRTYDSSIVFNFSGGGQAGKNFTAQEAGAAYLKNLGYKAHVYYMLD